MDDSVAENLYFNGEVGEDVDKHKENVEKALFFVSGSQKQLDKNTGTYPVESSHYEDGVYINNLATLKRSNFFGFSAEKNRYKTLLSRNSVMLAVPTDEPVNAKKE